MYGIFIYTSTIKIYAIHVGTSSSQSRGSWVKDLKLG